MTPARHPAGSDRPTGRAHFPGGHHRYSGALPCAAPVPLPGGPIGDAFDALLVDRCAHYRAGAAPGRSWLGFAGHTVTRPHSERYAPFCCTS